MALLFTCRSKDSSEPPRADPDDSVVRARWIPALTGSPGVQPGLYISPATCITTADGLCAQTHSSGPLGGCTDSPRHKGPFSILEGTNTLETLVHPQLIAREIFWQLKQSHREHKWLISFSERLTSAGDCSQFTMLYTSLSTSWYKQRRESLNQAWSFAPKPLCTTTACQCYMGIQSPGNGLTPKRAMLSSCRLEEKLGRRSTAG